MKIDITLSKSSVDNAIKQIERYRDSLERKCKEIENRLADDGALIAQNSISSEYAGYIDVSVRNGIAKDGSPCKEVVAENNSMIIAEWLVSSGEVKTAEVNPILMSEFGSGSHASEPFFINGQAVGGQGTFPGQTHAFDANGWYWKDLEGNLHHSRGNDPDAPMEKAMSVVLANAENTVKGVFRNGNI